MGLVSRPVRATAVGVVSLAMTALTETRWRRQRRWAPR